MALKHLTNQDFDEFIKNADKLVLVDFYADWCGPCKMVTPILEEIQQENENVIICKVNVDENPEIASKFSVVNIPTMISFIGGQPYKKIAGALPKDGILELIS